jgi:hypothetical protein
VAFLSSCPYPTRGTKSSPGGRRKWDESDWAEQVLFLRFIEDFKRRMGGGVFISQRDYLTQQYPGDGVTNTLFQMMSTYFRNWVPPGAFRQSPSTRKEGGPRKPDGMGISPPQRDGSIICELIEVKPVDNLADGKQQLNEQLSKLRDGMKAYLEELRTIQSVSPAINENTFKFIGSPFVPGPADLTFPLFSLSDQSPGDISWVCYQPTLDLRRALGQFTPSNPENDGILLYHIHTLDLRRSVQAFQALPKELRRAIREAFMAARKANNAVAPTLTPWATHSGRAAKAALRDQLLIAGAVVVVGVIVFCIFQPEFAPAGAGAISGIADAAVATTAADEALAGTMVEEVFTSYRVPTFFRVGADAFATHEEAMEFALDLVEDMKAGVP